MICKCCGQEIREGVSFCKYCGANISKQGEIHASSDIRIAQFFCIQCGKPHNGTNNFCIYCGSPIRNIASTVKKEPVIAQTTAPVYCAQCGRPMSAGMAFCAQCGRPVNRYPGVNTLPKKPTRNKKKLLISLVAGIVVIAAAVCLVMVLTAPKSASMSLGPSGGTIKLGDVEISLADGAAADSIDMTLTEDKSSEDFLPGSQTGVYILEEEGQGNEPITIRLKLNDGADTDSLCLCLGTKQLNSEGTEYPCFNYIDAEIEDGYITAEIIPSDYAGTEVHADTSSIQGSSMGAISLQPLAVLASPAASFTQPSGIILVISTAKADFYTSVEGHFRLTVPKDNKTPYITKDQAEDVLQCFEEEYKNFIDLGYTYSLRPANDRELDPRNDNVYPKPVLKQYWPFEVMITNTPDSGGYMEENAVLVKSDNAIHADNLLHPRKPETGFIELSRNDFNSGGGIGDIHDTIAHEWFHFVQGNYTAARNKSKTWFDDATATFFGSLENQTPSHNVEAEYFRNFKDLFPDTLTEIPVTDRKMENAREGYARAPLVDYLCALYAKANGTQGDTKKQFDFILRCYERIRDGSSPEEAITELIKPMDINYVSAHYYRFLVSGCVYDSSLAITGSGIFNKITAFFPYYFYTNTQMYKEFDQSMSQRTLSSGDIDKLKTGQPVELDKFILSLNNSVLLEAIDFPAQFSTDLPDGTDLVLKGFTSSAYAYLYAIPNPDSKLPTQVIEVSADGSFRIPDIKTALQNKTRYLLAVSDINKNKTAITMTTTLEPGTITLDKLAGAWTGKMTTDVHVDQVVFDILNKGIEQGDYTAGERLDGINQWITSTGQTVDYTFNIKIIDQNNGEIYVTGASIPFTYANGVITIHQEIKDADGHLMESYDETLTASYGKDRSINLSGKITDSTHSIMTSVYYDFPSDSYVVTESLTASMPMP